MGVRRILLLLLAGFTLLPLALSTGRAAEEAKESFYIWGEVKKPGAYPWKRGMTVAGAIQQAGGFTDAANRGRATLTRGQRELVLTSEDLTSTGRDAPRVEVGDVIRIEKGAIRVEGEVRAPGEYGLEHNTVRQALVAAGGPTEAADLESAYIARGGQVIRVDARKALIGGPNVENPRLEPGDVLHVPKQETRVSIAGEVRRPGPYTLEPGKLERLEDLIAAAGGPTANARLTDVKLQRAGQREAVSINLQKRDVDELQRNPVLHGGDYVLVPARSRGRSISLNDIAQLALIAVTILQVLRR